MKNNIGINKFLFFLFSVILLLGIVVVAKGQAQTAAKAVSARSEIQQPPYREYRGIRLGMTATEVRAKLGEPALKSDEQDFYVVSATETAQIAYNGAHQVMTISTDYMNGVGAPEYQTVVGQGLLERPDGSLFRMVIHDAEKYWVSYNKSASVISVITVTIGVMK